MENAPHPEDSGDSSREDPLVRAGVQSPPAFGTAGKYMGLGVQFAGSILVFLWLGQWLDRKFETGVLFVLIGVFVGAGAAFYSMYRNLMADQRRDEAATAAKKRADAERKQER